eukprot:scaffold105068_cov28-Phaeocystis_antarctica.AAC.2
MINQFINFLYPANLPRAGRTATGVVQCCPVSTGCPATLPLTRKKALYFGLRRLYRAMGLSQPAGAACGAARGAACGAARGAACGAARGAACGAAC